MFHNDHLIQQGATALRAVKHSCHLFWTMNAICTIFEMNEIFLCLLLVVLMANIKAASNPEPRIAVPPAKYPCRFHTSFSAKRILLESHPRNIVSNRLPLSSTYEYELGKFNSSASSTSPLPSPSSSLMTASYGSHGTHNAQSWSPHCAPAASSCP